MGFVYSVLGALAASWTWNVGVLTFVAPDRPAVGQQWLWLSAAMRTVFLVVAVWRVAFMLVMEDGPWALVARVRSLRGTLLSPNHELIATRVGTAWSCINCMSVWVALWLPFLPSQIIAILALSGLAIWCRRHIL